MCKVSLFMNFLNFHKKIIRGIHRGRCAICAAFVRQTQTFLLTKETYFRQYHNIVIEILFSFLISWWLCTIESIVFSSKWYTSQKKKILGRTLIFPELILQRVDKSIFEEEWNILACISACRLIKVQWYWVKIIFLFHIFNDWKQLLVIVIYKSWNL